MIWDFFFEIQKSMNKLAKRALKSSSLNEGKIRFIRFFQLLEIQLSM